MAFKVLASDPLDASAVKAMRDAGLVVDEKTDLTPEALLREIAAYDAIVVRSATKVRAEVIDAGVRLKLIVRAGVGLDNVDAVHAKEKNVAVRNTPGASSNSVAELALGHMLSIARHIGRGTASTKAGKWEKKQLEGVELAGKTLGVIGIGRIGQLLAQKAHALGMTVVCFDAFLTASPIPSVAKFVSFDELLAASDFISLHIPFDAAEGADARRAGVREDEAGRADRQLRSRRRRRRGGARCARSRAARWPARRSTSSRRSLRRRAMPSWVRSTSR